MYDRIYPSEMLYHTHDMKLHYLNAKQTHSIHSYEDSSMQTWYWMLIQKKNMDTILK